MSNTRMQTDPAAERDSAVSQAYREIATERVPEHIDRAVLDAAAQAARPAYSRLRFWTRPAAWAAVVMLSVALILETGQGPVPGTLPPASNDVAGSDAPVSPPPIEADDADARAAAEVAERKAEAPVRKSDFNSNGMAPSETRELRAGDNVMPETAVEAARLRQDREAQAEPALAPASSALRREAAERSDGLALSLDEASSACDAAARAEPESWLDCIRQLEEDGLFDAARDERAQLEETFPDFATR